MTVEKKLSIAVSIALTAAAYSGQVVAQQAQADIEKISVIGSRLSVRSATETSAPLDIIGADQLAATGALETAKALQLLVPSFNFPTSSITDGSDAVRPASLRGLSPDHTLVLVNGKRRHGTALVHLNGTMGRGSSNVDLNAIPISAIKRIEVLRDGAAAQYGSDAIAGVINIVLKDQAQSTDVSLSTGQTYKGDGEYYKASLNSGFRFANTGFVNFSVEHQHKNGTNRAGPDPRQQYASINGEPDPREAGFNRLSHKVGDAAFEQQAVFVNAGYQQDNKVQWYGFGGLSHRESSSGAFYRRASDARNITDIYPDGFLPEIAPQSSDYSLTAGVKFELADWQVDLSAGTGESEFDYYVNNSLNASFGPGSPTSAYAGTLQNSEQNFNIDASKGFDFVNNSELVVSAGISRRHNAYRISAGDELSWRNYGYQGKAGGIQGFGGFTPESEVDESRHNTAVYVELENALSDNFTWGAALRQEDYSDFGSDTSWKLSGRYQLNEQWALRATANDAFRAPSVQQLYFSNLSTLFVADPQTGVLTPTESGTFNNISTVTRAIGQGPLQPESATSISAGITFQGDSGLTFTLDTYRIAIDDRIILTGSVNRASSAVLDQLLGDSGADSVRFFTNAVDTTTQGVEAVLAYQWDAGLWGQWKTSFSAQYNDSSIDSIKVPQLLDGLQQRLFDRVEQVRLTKANPNKGAVWSVNHQHNKLTSDVRLNYFGPYTLGYATGDKTYSGKVTVDVSFNYALTDTLQLGFGASNLFDTYPDKQPEVNSFNGIFVYPNTNAPFGFNGGSYYADLRYSF
ncbi:TonB-dependent receptor [Rheinheimera muenzenbergensis]|uniref:TonB-dependent receptor n=1 Tax=Rheinheimera muenzenbergensis TaxID=1193628 RepID=A0ABU8C3T6_9GAMM